MKTRFSSLTGYVLPVGVISGFVSVVFLSAWSQMLPRFSRNPLISDGWVICSMLLCVLLGSLYFGPRVLRVSSRLRLLAYMQIGAGISGLVAVQLLPAVGAVAGAISGAGSAAQTTGAGLLAFGIFFVPCFLMGGIMIFAASLVAGWDGDPGTGTGRLAALVFLGCAAGAWLSTFTMVPALGYWRTLLVAATLIGAAGLVGLLVRETAGSEIPRKTDGAVTGGDNLRSPVAAVASTAFIAGTLVCVILWMRLLAQVIGQSVYAGAIMLTVYLAGVAIGSAVSPLFAGRSRSPAFSLICMSALTGVYWLAISHALDHMPSVFLDALGSGPLTWGRLVTSQLRLSVLVMSLPAILTGASLPLLGGLHPDPCRAGTPAAGRAAISVAALGALLAFTVTRALPAGSLTFRLLLTAASWLCLAAALAFAAVTRRPAWFRVVVSLVVIAAGIAVSLSLPRWRRDVLTSGVFTRLRELPALEDLRATLRGSDLVFYDEDGDVITSVERSPDGIALKTNGRISASTGEDLMSQILSAQIPLLIHDDPGRVLLVGLGTGMTLGSIETHNVAEIVCVEPVAAAERAAQAFSHHSRNATGDTRVRLITGDPVNYLLSDGSFDVVILQPPSARSCRPGRFLTAEFVALVRSRLAEGGVMCQRLSTKGLPAEAFKAAVKAFAIHFPNVEMWWAGAGELVLIGSMESLNLDLESLDRRMSEPEVARDLARLRITDHVGILGCYTADRASLLEFAGDVPANTDDNTLIDHNVPRALALHDPTEVLEAIDSIKQNPISVVVGIEEASAQFSLLRDRLDRFMKARTLYVNSLVFAWSGRLAEAIAGLEQAAELSPENGIFLIRLSDYYIALSRGLAAAGRQEDALKAARQSVEVNPLSYRAFYNLATIEMTRNGTMAIALLRRATELNPGYVPAYLLKAEGELASGDPEEASRTVGEVLSIEPFNVSARHLRALSLLDRGMLAEGVAVLETILEAEPDNIEVINALAYTSFMADDLGRAERLYQRILKIDPNHLAALNNYATVLAEKGDYREAIRIWTKALGRDPGNRNIIDNIEEARQKLRR